VDGIPARASRRPIQEQGQEVSFKSEWQTWRKTPEGFWKLVHFHISLSALRLSALSAVSFGLFGWQITNFKL
jgi:hypothetical protein